MNLTMLVCKFQVKLPSLSTNERTLGLDPSWLQRAEVQMQWGQKTN